jgi:hypothetical protein
MGSRRSFSEERNMHNKMVCLLSYLFIVACSAGFAMKGKKASEIFKDEKEIRLCRAAETGDVEEIDELLAEGVNIESRGLDGVTPLFCAIYQNNKKGFEHLLKRGANPNSPMNDGDAVIMIAAHHPDPWYLVTALEHGGNPNYYMKNAGFYPSPIFLVQEKKMLIYSSC